eukprot:m.177504 g.177504  ORF g.177504 m.177504 type:complete len:435 (+) comp31896_c0_seq2:208-1512(+)
MSLSVWTHHQLLKATSPINFTQGRLAKGATNKAAQEVLRELTRARKAYLEQVGDPATSSEIVVRSCNEYVSLLIGLLQLPAPTEGTDTNIPVSVRVRKAILFKWRDVLSGQVVDIEDLRGELISVLLNCGLWHCLYASRLMGSAAEDDEDAQKNIYRALLAAASYFDHVDTDQLSKFKFVPKAGEPVAHDLDEKIVKCIAEQLLAEAQEVTVNRARVKGHKDELIAALALNEHDRFVQAKAHIESMDAKLVEDIWSYFDFKIDYYDAMSLCYNGEHLFKQDKAGAAIKCFREATMKFEQCQKTALTYSKKRSKRKNLSKSTTIKDVTEAPAFLSLGKTIKSSLEKAEHENGFIYKEKIPSELPELIVSKSLIEKKTFDFPQESILFQEAKFDPAKVPIRGKDHSADTASSDNNKVQSGPHHSSGLKDDNYCSLM